MNTTISPELHAALQIIYDAYDRVYDIASHRWYDRGPGLESCRFADIQYHDQKTMQSTLMGHYVRSLSRFQDHRPEHITDEQYKEFAQPLVDAINLVQATFRPVQEREADIETICRRPTIYYPHPSAYDRCLSVFRHIERAYPRAIHRDGAKPQRTRKKKERIRRSTMIASSYRRPQPTVRWTPYKD